MLFPAILQLSLNIFDSRAAIYFQFRSHEYLFSLKLKFFPEGLLVSFLFPLQVVQNDLFVICALFIDV